MKSNVLKENLKEGLVIVEHIATKSLSLPVLNNILITATNHFMGYGDHWHRRQFSGACRLVFLH